MCDTMKYKRALGFAGFVALASFLSLDHSASAVVVQVNGLTVPSCVDHIGHALARGELAGNVSGSGPSQSPFASRVCWSQAPPTPDAQDGFSNASLPVALREPAVPNNGPGGTGSQGAIDPV